MPSPPRFVVRRSRIHGRGAFAAVALRAGARVAEYVGEVIASAEADRRSDALPDDGHTFFFAIPRRRVIDGGRGGDGSRFINHSCAPNCEARMTGDRVFVYALRAIAAGEELTYDYGLWLEGPYRAAWKRDLRCACGAPRCRGMLVRLRPENRVGRDYERLLRARAAGRSERPVARRPRA